MVNFENGIDSMLFMTGWLSCGPIWRLGVKRIRLFTIRSYSSIVGYAETNGIIVFHLSFA